MSLSDGDGCYVPFDFWSAHLRWQKQIHQRLNDEILIRQSLQKQVQQLLQELPRAQLKHQTELDRNANLQQCLTHLLNQLKQVATEKEALYERFEKLSFDKDVGDLMLDQYHTEVCELKATLDRQAQQAAQDGAGINYDVAIRCDKKGGRKRRRRGTRSKA